MIKAVGLTEFGSPEVLKSVKIEKPVPGARQVLIRVQGTSVNYADIMTRKGNFHGSSTVFPVIPGLDAMGVIESLGNQVKNLKVGQRVIAFPHTGTYSEYVAADDNLVFPIPKEISFEQAAACPLVSFTSQMLLNKVARLQRGETVLIHAASGGIGTTAIQIAKSMEAGLIIGTVGSNEKVQQALKAGADEVIVNNSEDFVSVVNELTDGKGADIIMDSLGGGYSNRGMNCLAPYGRIVVFGSASGSYSNIDTKLLHSSCRSILGYSIITTRKTKPEWFAETAEKVLKLMVSEKLNIKVSQTLEIEDAATAHELIENRAVTGKVILRV